MGDDWLIRWLEDNQARANWFKARMLKRFAIIGLLAAVAIALDCCGNKWLAVGVAFIGFGFTLSSIMALQKERERMAVGLEVMAAYAAAQIGALDAALAAKEEK